MTTQTGYATRLPSASTNGVPNPLRCSVPRHLAPSPPAFGGSTGGEGSMSVRKLAKYGVRKRSLGAKDLGSGNTSGWVSSCFVWDPPAKWGLGLASSSVLDSTLRAAYIRVCRATGMFWFWAVISATSNCGILRVHLAHAR